MQLWFPAVYMICMSQNFRLFHVSNLSLGNYRIFCACIRGSVYLTCDQQSKAADVVFACAQLSAVNISRFCGTYQQRTALTKHETVDSTQGMR